MTKVYVNGAEYSWSSREADTDDEWDRGDSQTDRSITSASVTKSHDTLDYFESEVDLQKGDTVYVVIAQYSTGNTFGYDGNARMEISDVVLDKDKASELVAALKSSEAYQISVGDKTYYCPWVGYFEHLNDIDVYEFTLE